MDWGPESWQAVKALSEDLRSAGLEKSSEQLVDALRYGSTGGELLENVFCELRTLAAQTLPEDIMQRVLILKEAHREMGARCGLIFFG